MPWRISIPDIPFFHFFDLFPPYFLLLKRTYHKKSATVFKVQAFNHMMAVNGTWLSRCPAQR